LKKRTPLVKIVYEATKPHKLKNGGAQMNYTQNEKINQVTESSLVIGIDIASEVQYARAFDWRGVEIGNVFKFENSRAGFENFSGWISNLKAKHKKNEVIAGAEPTGHYWFGLAGYMKEVGIKLVLVNPFHVKRSKEFDDNNQSKTDSKDPKTIAKLVIDGRYMEPRLTQKIMEIRKDNHNLFFFF
jgi:transposase